MAAPADAEPLTVLYGVGPFIANRLGAAPYHIGNVGELRAWVNHEHRRSRITNMVNAVTLNARRGQCVEGYVVREHNKLGRDGLIAFMVQDPAIALNPLLAPAFADKSRNPFAGNFDRRITDPPVRYEGGHAFRFAKPQYQHVPVPAVGAHYNYPYGKAPPLPEALTVAQRNAQIRNNLNIQANRKYWPCSCFRSRKTCHDFLPAKHSRMGSGMPDCRWAGGTCGDA